MSSVQQGEHSVAKSSTRRVVVGFADQGVSSLSNLALAALIARSAAPREFGAFAIAYAVYVFALGGSLSLNSEFFAIRYSGTTRREHSSGVGRAMGGALIVGLIVGAVTAMVGLVTSGTTVGLMLVIVGLSLPLLLMQDAIRNLLIATGRPGWALAGDTGWLIALVAVAEVVLPQSRTAMDLLITWAICGSVSALILLLVVGRAPTFRDVVPAWRQNAATVGPLFTEFLVVEGSWQLTILLLPILVGLSALAGLRAAMTVFGPLNVLFNAVRSVTVPELVRARKRGASVIRGSLLVSGTVGGLMLVLVGIIMFAPMGWGRQVFGATWPLASAVLLPVGLARMVGGIGTGPLAGLRAMGATRASFQARSSSALIGLSLTLLGGRLGGVRWAAWGMAAGAVITILFLWQRLIAAAARSRPLGSASHTGTDGGRPNVLWITNIPVPYRVPVWRELAESTRLHVCFQAGSEPNRSWDLQSDLADIDHSFLRSRRVKGASTPLYLPGTRVSRVVGSRPWALVVIDGWESPAYWQAALAARRGGIPVIAMYRSTLKTRRFTRGPVAAIRRRFLNSCVAVITAGTDSSRAVLADGVEGTRIFAVFNPVDVRRIAEEALASRHEQETVDGHRFLVVGQLIERKNVGAVLAAFADMADPADSLTLAGVGPLEAELRAHAVRLGLGQRVVFLGAVEPGEMGRLYGRSHTLVLGSTREVWGLVVNEALAAGLHAVVSDAAGVAAAVETMPGVFISSPRAPELSIALRRSRESWSGPIQSPQILAHGPSALADVILESVSTGGMWSHV